MERFRMWERERELDRRVDSKVYIGEGGGRWRIFQRLMTFLGGTPVVFLGHFLCWQYSQVSAAVAPFFAPMDTSQWAVGWREGGHARRWKKKKKDISLQAFGRRDRHSCTIPKRKTRTVKRTHGKTDYHTCITGETQGPPPPHLFLTSSQHSRVGVMACLSLMFHLAGTAMSLYMYHKPSSLVGATVLFCTFAVPLSFVPEPNTFWSTYMSPLPADTSLRPDRATSCPPELGLNASWDLGTFQSVYLCWFRPIAHNHPCFFFFFFLAFSHVHMTLLQRLSWWQLDHDACFLHGVLWRFWSGSMDPQPAAQGVSCDLLSLYHQCHWVGSSLTFAPKTITIITVDVRSFFLFFFFVTVTHKVSKPSPFVLL